MELANHHIELTGNLYAPRHRNSRPWIIVHESKGTGKTRSTIGTTRQQTKRVGHQRAAHLGYSYHCNLHLYLQEAVLCIWSHSRFFFLSFLNTLLAIKMGTLESLSLTLGSFNIVFSISCY